MGEGLHTHVAEDVLEKHALGQLSEAECEPVEEHLLLCGPCQERFQFQLDFVSAAKSVMRENELRDRQLARQTRTNPKPWWMAIPAAAAAMAIVVGVVYQQSGRQQAPHSAELSLTAMRGSEPVAHLPAGSSPAILTLDASTLPFRNAYVIQVVNSSGAEVYRTAATPAKQFAVTIPKALNRGAYWVRVLDTAPGNEVLLEFGFAAE